MCAQNFKYTFIRFSHNGIDKTGCYLIYLEIYELKSINLKIIFSKAIC